MTIGFYGRVSTEDQSIENQLFALYEVASRQGWIKPGDALCVYADHGFSGRLGRKHRPAYDQLLQDVADKKVTTVLAWSIDRIGRSVKETIAFMEELTRHKCKIYLHQQQMDTSTPYGAAMLQMAMIFAELESKIIGQRIREGYRRCRQEGRKIGRFPAIPTAKQGKIRKLLQSGKSVREVAAKVDCGSSSVQRIRRMLMENGSL